MSYHVLVAEGATFRLYHVNGALEIVLAEVNEDGQPASKIAWAEAVELRNWLNRVLPRQESVETSAPNKEVNDLRNHIFNGVDLIEHLLRDPTEQAKAWAREWCATEIARSAVEPSLAPTPEHAKTGTYVTIVCEGCHAQADLPRVGREGEFMSLQPAIGWTLYPKQLCPKCSSGNGGGL